MKDTNASNQAAMGDRLLFLVLDSGLKALVRLIGKGVCRGQVRGGHRIPGDNDNEKSEIETWVQRKVKTEENFFH